MYISMQVSSVRGCVGRYVGVGIGVGVGVGVGWC